MGNLTKLKQKQDTNQPKFVGEGCSLLTPAGERVLSDTIGKLVTEGLDFPVWVAKRICYEYCDANNVPVKFNKERVVSDDWFIEFLKRNPEVAVLIRTKSSKLSQAAGIKHDGSSGQRLKDSVEDEGSDDEDDGQDNPESNENQYGEGDDVGGDGEDQTEEEESDGDEDDIGEEDSDDEEDYEGNEDSDDLSDSDIDEEEELGDDEEEVNDELQNVIDAAIQVGENAENVGGGESGALSGKRSTSDAAEMEGGSPPKKKKK